MKTLKGLKFIALAFTLATSISANAALLAKWSFDEQSGTIASDSTGAFPGTLSPSGSAFVPGGISGGAISLNRVANGFVSMSNVFNVTGGDFSLVAWVKMSAGDRTPDSILVGKHAAFSRNGYFIHLNQSSGLAMQSTDKAFFFQGGAGVGQIQRSETPLSTTSINDGNWHQIVAVHRSGGMKKIYVDGSPAEDTKPSQTFVGNTVAFLIGGVSENGVPKGRLTGLVDEVQFYNHALSESDVDFLLQNPAQTILDCEQNVAALQAQLATANSIITNLQIQLAASDARVGELENEIGAINEPIARLESQLQAAFKNPQFQIPGGTTSAAVNNIVIGIENLNHGAQQSFYINVGGVHPKVLR